MPMLTSVLSKKINTYSEKSVFYLKPFNSIRDVCFFDNDTDCIVLEILPNTKGTPMPLPFSLFSYPKLEEGFHIIGHTEGLRKTFDRVDGFIDPRNEKSKKDIHTAIRESKKFLALHGKDKQEYPFDVAQTIFSNCRILFHCTLSHGASGAPGVVVDDEGRVIVVTMLLHGYPDWYYDPKSLSFRAGWPKQYCFEQGASMEAIFKQMQKDNPELCQEIFDQRGGELCKEIFDQRKRAEMLRDLCFRFGRKSSQLKLECDLTCNQIRSLEGVKYVYSAYRLTANNDVTFVVTIENDQGKHAVETFLKCIGIEYEIQMLQFKNNETTALDHKINIQQTDEEIKRLGECIKSFAPQLFLKHKYLSIIQGSKRQVNYKETEETSNFEAYLELYVHAKGCIPIEEDPFEKKYNGIPVHVRNGVFLPLSKHADDIHDNIRMGCAISRRYERSGTLGLFFEHVQYGLCGIASAHVLLSDSELEQCKKQLGKYQPQDQKEVYQPRFPHLIGKLVEVINKEGDSLLPGLEIGLVAIENRKPENGRFPDPRRGNQLDINYSSGRTDKPWENNRKCVKFGSATNYTTGIIERLMFPNVARTLPWTLKSGLTELKLYNQLQIEPTQPTEPFADFGDSGAPVFVIDGDGQPVCVGIVAGGISDSRTVMVTPITVILEVLGISKFKTFKPNLEKLQQDIHVMKQQISELLQHLLPPRSENE